MVLPGTSVTTRVVQQLSIWTSNYLLVNKQYQHLTGPNKNSIIKRVRSLRVSLGVKDRLRFTSNLAVVFF